MEQIQPFVSLAQTERFTLTELCAQFGISRKTGYKHLKRCALGGFKALEPRSSRPLCSPARTDEAVTELILLERRLHRTWGPKKLRVMLETRHGIPSPPACSTIAGVLKRHGLSVRRRRWSGVYHTDAHGCTRATQPNQVWTVDFKGWFTLGLDVLRTCSPGLIERAVLIHGIAYNLVRALMMKASRIHSVPLARLSI